MQFDSIFIFKEFNYFEFNLFKSIVNRNRRMLRASYLRLTTKILNALKFLVQSLQGANGVFKNS